MSGAVARRQSRMECRGTYPYQAEFIMSDAAERYVVSSTQLGKTEAAAALCNRWAFTRPGTRGWWAAPTYRQAFGGWETFCRQAAEAGVLYDSTESALWAATKNGSQFECRSWEKPKNLLGPPVDWCVVEEASLLNRVAHAIISTRRAATLGPIAYIGNADHVGSEFYRLCKMAEADAADGNRDVFFRRWTWRDRAAALAPTQRAAYLRFLDRERVRLGDEGFRQLYEADFLKLGAGVLDLAPVCTLGGDAAHPRPLPWHEPWILDDMVDEKIKREHDLDAGEPCVGGMDLGDKQSWTVPVVFGRQSGRMKALHRFRHLGWKATAARATAIFTQYGLVHPETGRPLRTIVVFFDKTGVGDVVAEELRDAAVGTPVRYRGIVFGQDNKQSMVSALQIASESASISMPYVAEAVEECELLERVPLSRGVTYRAPAGGTSDIVWSLGLAVHGMTKIVSGGLA